MNLKFLTLAILSTLSIAVFAPIAQAALSANALSANALSANALSANGLTLHGLSVKQIMQPTGLRLSSPEYKSIQVQDGHLVGIR